MSSHPLPCISRSGVSRAFYSGMFISIRNQATIMAYICPKTSHGGLVVIYWRRPDPFSYLKISNTSFSERLYFDTDNIYFKRRVPVI